MTRNGRNGTGTANRPWGSEPALTADTLAADPHEAAADTRTADGTEAADGTGATADTRAANRPSGSEPALTADTLAADPHEAAADTRTADGTEAADGTGATADTRAANRPSGSEPALTADTLAADPHEAAADTEATDGTGTADSTGAADRPGAAAGAGRRATAGRSVGDRSGERRGKGNGERRGDSTTERAGDSSRNRAGGGTGDRAGGGLGRGGEDTARRAARHWRATAPDAVLLDGFHALKHALRFGATVHTALTCDKAAVLALAAELAADVTQTVDALAVEVPASVLRGLVPRVHPTGVAALAVRPSRPANLAALAERPRRAPTVVLDGPRNLGNVGAVVRLAAGIGATGVITIGELDPWHPGAVRGGAGLHFATAVERLEPAELPSGPLYALDPQGEDIRSVTIPDDALLAFGSERHGISAGLRARADRLLAVPMRPEVSSFNLATTVAMALYHWLPSPDRALTATPAPSSPASDGAS